MQCKFYDNKFLKSAPFAFEIRKCITNCKQSQTLPSPTIVINLKDFNLNNMKESLRNYYICPKLIDCFETDCVGRLTITNILENHIFIETDVISENRMYSLANFLTTLQINNNRHIIYNYYPSY